MVITLVECRIGARRGRASKLVAEELDPGRRTGGRTVLWEKKTSVTECASQLSYVSYTHLTTSAESSMSREALELTDVLLHVCFRKRKNQPPARLSSRIQRSPRGVLDRSNTRRVCVHCEIRIINVIRSLAPLRYRVPQALLLRTERIIVTSIV